MLWIDDLVAADGPEVRLLKLEGIDCECAPTGMLGLARAFGARWNAIVLDLRLPDMDGLGVLRELANRPNAPGVGVLTGFGTVDSTVTAMRLGALDVRSKPLIGEDLVAYVKDLTG